MKIFKSLEMAYYNIGDLNAGSQFDVYLPSNMTEMKMMIETRPRYPSNKLTFTIANITKGLISRVFAIKLYNLNGGFDVDIVLEDSQRNFLSSILLFFSEVVKIMAMFPQTLRRNRRGSKARA